jgi:hypothetical protein
VKEYGLGGHARQCPPPKKNKKIIKKIISFYVEELSPEAPTL